ncbi:MAG: hypothetical protein ACOZB3_00575 [Calditrichota bacterium]
MTRKLLTLAVFLLLPTIALTAQKIIPDVASQVPAHRGSQTLDQGGEDCFSAFNLTLAGYVVPFSISGFTDDALNDYDCSLFGPLPPPCWDGWYDQFQSCAGGDVVYRWTAPANGDYTFSLCGSDFDTGLLIFNPACPPTPGDYLCGNDDQCGLQSEVSLPLIAGQEVLIVVDGYSGASGLYTLTVAQAAPHCTFDSFYDIATPLNPELLIGAEVMNTTLVPSTLNHVLGRSLLVGMHSADFQSLDFLAIKLNQYLPLPGPLPEFLFSIPESDISFSQPLSFCLIERGLGVERDELVMPSVVSDANGPLILLAGEATGQFAVLNLEGDVVAGPYSGADLGLINFSPRIIVIDDDILSLYVYDQTNQLIHTIDLSLDAPPVLIASAPLPWTLPPTAQIESMWLADSFFDIFVQVDLGGSSEIRSLNMSDPLAPAPGPTCTIDTEILAMSLSSGFGPAGTGQLVGLRPGFTGFEVIVGEPLLPAPLPLYLQPVGTIQIASEDELNLQGTIDIHGSLLGPWWPDRVRFQTSYDGVNFTDFFVDYDGLDHLAHTVSPSPFYGDGWQAQLTPATVEPESLYIQLCYEIEVNGVLVYVVRKVKIQDAFKPDVVQPGEDGEIVFPPVAPGGIVHPHPTRVDCTVVFRRIPPESVADSIRSIAQRRDSLSSWGSGVSGGDHCGPTAAASNLLALASRNADLCKLLEKFWGRAPGTGCANPTPAELTKLLKEIGKCMKTNDGHCGTWASDILPGIECFIKKMQRAFPDSTRPDPNLRAHWIPCGSNYDSLKWEDIKKEFIERHQTVEFLATDTLKSYGHYMTLKSMSEPDSAGIVTVEIADSWDDTVWTVKIDTRKSPPRFVEPLPAGDFWGQITAAFAVSNPDSLTADDFRERWGDLALDEDRYSWDIVQVESGASTSFPIDDSVPGWWTYGVRVWTPEGDSATTYRTIYIATPPELVIHAVGSDVELNWQTDPRAVGYIIWVADEAGGPYTLLDVVAAPPYTVSFGSADQKFFRVQPRWSD